MQSNPIVRTVARLLAPFIMLYAFYVIAHGDLGPGGGFQGGVIFASALILYAMVYGPGSARAIIGRDANDILISVGVLIYAGVGLACLFFGGNFLEYAALPFHDPAHASHYAIFAIEVGVGTTVAAVMLTIFHETGRRRPEPEGAARDAADSDGGGPRQ